MSHNFKVGDVVIRKNAYPFSPAMTYEDTISELMYPDHVYLAENKVWIRAMYLELAEPIHQPGGSTPEQYGLPFDAEELQDLIEYREMNFALGNILKACYRRGTCSHSDELRDMRKVLWFAQREIDRLEREEEE